MKGKSVFWKKNPIEDIAEDFSASLLSWGGICSCFWRAREDSIPAQLCDRTRGAARKRTFLTIFFRCEKIHNGRGCKSLQMPVEFADKRTCKHPAEHRHHS